MCGLGRRAAGEVGCASSGIAASATEQPSEQRGSTDVAFGRGAGAALALGDTPEDLVDVLTAPAVGGLAASVAGGGTTHGGLLGFGVVYCLRQSVWAAQALFVRAVPAYHLPPGV